MNAQTIIKPQKISEQILAVLEARIVSGEYPVGSKLPPERRLAEAFGVSRPSVRAALKMLVARQMLEARQGDGYMFPPSRNRIFCSAGKACSATIPIGRPMCLISAAAWKAAWLRWRPSGAPMPI